MVTQKDISKSGTKFVSVKFKEFSMKLNIEQGILSSYNHQSDCQGEPYILFIKRMKKNCFDTNADVTLYFM